MQTNISEKALLVLPRWSVWTARRFDKKATEEVAANHGAKAERAGRFNKALIDVKHPLYVAITKVEGEARRYHEKHTLPWSQDGARILPATMYQEYTVQMGTYREQFEHAVTQFVREYPALREAAKVDLNGLYNDADYPSDVEVESKFGFRISIFPVPVAHDFRVTSIDEDAMAAIRRNLEAEVQDAVKDAECDRWRRLMEVVSKAVERLSTQDATFRDTLIGNIKSACDTLPKLALSEDKDFTAVLQEVKDKLSVCDPDRLRTDRGARADAARKAAEIMQKMSAYMGR